MIKQIYYQKFCAKENNYPCKNLITQFFQTQINQVISLLHRRKIFLLKNMAFDQVTFLNEDLISSRC